MFVAGNSTLQAETGECQAGATAHDSEDLVERLGSDDRPPLGMFSCFTCVLFFLNQPGRVPFVQIRLQVLNCLSRSILDLLVVVLSAACFERRSLLQIQGGRGRSFVLLLSSKFHPETLEIALSEEDSKILQANGVAADPLDTTRNGARMHEEKPAEAELLSFLCFSCPHPEFEGTRWWLAHKSTPVGMLICWCFAGLGHSLFNRLTRVTAVGSPLVDLRLVMVGLGRRDF